ncbi:MAG: tetratricopeptide repeat protein [Bacteroidota bacterium]
MKTTIASFLLVLCLYNPLWSQTDEVRKLIQEGIELHDKRLYAAAIERYKEAIKLDPNSAAAYYEMAYSYALMGETKKSIKNANKVLKLGGSLEGQAYMLKANLLDDMGKTSKALKTYEIALAENPDDYLMHFNYGISLVRAQMLERGEIALLNGAQLNPSHPSGHYILGLIMTDKGEYAQAIMSLYYFLLLEPEGERADKAHELLMQNIVGNATKEEDGSINITLNALTATGTFATANTLISLLGAAADEINKEKGIERSPAQLNNDRFKNAFNYLMELDADNPTEAEQIWLDLYVDFYRKLLEEEQHLETASFLVQGPGDDDEVKEWLLGHQKEVQRLQTFVGK